MSWARGHCSGLQVMGRGLRELAEQAQMGSGLRGWVQILPRPCMSGPCSRDLASPSLSFLLPQWSACKGRVGWHVPSTPPWPKQQALSKFITIVPPLLTEDTSWVLCDLASPEQVPDTGRMLHKACEFLPFPCISSRVCVSRDTWTVRGGCGAWR